MSVRSAEFLRGGLSRAQLKDSLVASWGCIPAINLLHSHVARLTAMSGARIIVVNGAGHGLEASLANAFLNGSLAAVYPKIGEGGLDRLLREYDKNPRMFQAAALPGTLQSGLELGHSLAHAYGLILDNPDLIACALIGDGEAETGPLSAAWFSHAYTDIRRDGTVLPVINLNGFKFAGKTQLSRLDNGQLKTLMRGLGYRAQIVEGIDSEMVHFEFARAMEEALASIKANRSQLEKQPDTAVFWPCLILKTPKGWTAPKITDEGRYEGTAKTSLLENINFHEDQNSLKLLERWLHSYSPAKLMSKSGELLPEVRRYIPAGELQSELLQYTNGGGQRSQLSLPSSLCFATNGDADKTIGDLVSAYLCHVFTANKNNFRLFSSNGINTALHFQPISSATSRAFGDSDEYRSESDNVIPGRIMEVLSQHTAQGWLEGYIQSGRHGVFLCSEQYGSIVDSMLLRFRQWLAECKMVSWRRPIPALNYLISSTNWIKGQRDQFVPTGFFDILFDDKENLTNIFMPADKATAIASLQKALPSENCINAVFVEPESHNHWLDAQEAAAHVESGIGIWQFACTGDCARPDLIFLSLGATASQESVAAIGILSSLLPGLSVRLVNACNPKTLLPAQFTAESLSDAKFDELFPDGCPVVAALPWPAGLISDLVGLRFGSRPLKVHTWRTNHSQPNGALPGAINRLLLAQSALSMVSVQNDELTAAEANLLAMINEFQL